MKSAIAHFVTSLFSKTDKTILMQRFDHVFSSLEDNTLPMLQMPDALGKDTKMYRLIESQLKAKNFEMRSYRDAPIPLIRNVFEKLIENKDKYRKIYEDSFRKEIFTTALSYNQVNLLALLVAIDDAAYYMRKYAVVAARLSMGMALNKVESEYLRYLEDEKKVASLAITLYAVNLGPDKTKQALDAIKDLSYNADSEELVSRIRVNSDPLKLGLIPGLGNIVLFALELRNDVVKMMYDAAKNDKSKFEMQLMYLQEEAKNASGEELARIEKQIAYYQSQVNKAEAKYEDIRREVQNA